MLVVPGSENGHVEESSEYRFYLYRHWSLYDSMYHSPYVAAKMNVWNNQGTAQLLVSVYLLCVISLYWLFSLISPIAYVVD